MSTARNRAEKTEFLIGLLCLGATERDLHIWSAVHTLALLALVSLMRVEFLPVIPQPITEHATVKHALTNFQSIRKQVNQKSMVVWCDEGVFYISADICLSEL